MAAHVPKLGRGQNRHHVFWENRWYKGRVENEFRNHAGLVIPMNAQDHADLHYELRPPKKPNHDQMRHILGLVALWTPEQGRLAAVINTRDEFYDLSISEHRELSIGALAIANHLNNQLEYMQLTPVVGKALSGR